MTAVRTRGLAGLARAWLPAWCVILAVGTARSDEPDVMSSEPLRPSESDVDRQRGEPEGQRDLWFEVPAACAAYIPERRPDPDRGWQQLLSFASCVQDATVARVTEPRQLALLVRAMTEAMSPALLLYLEALQHAPPPVQLRAAYLAGLAHVALITRLRSSLAEPEDPANVAELRRHLELHAQLEPMLIRAQRTAWVAFTVVGRAAEQDPTLAMDPVAAKMIASARVMLSALGGGVREVPATRYSTSVAKRD